MLKAAGLIPCALNRSLQALIQPGSVASLSPLAVTYGIEVPIFLALTAVAAVAAYHLLEAPMVRLGRRLSG